MAQTIPMAIISVASGSVDFQQWRDNQHLNPLGGVHGGFAATVLDSVTGCAVHSLLESGVGICNSRSECQNGQARPARPGIDRHREGYSTVRSSGRF